LISLCGQLVYFKLKFGYYLKNISVKSQIRNSDILICGSQWAKDQFVSIYNLSPKAVQTLPYPVDMSQFKPNKSLHEYKSHDDNKVFLCLGRSDPRKRLDLLLEAYELLLNERRDVTLKIIGGFSYAEGYKKLIDEFKFPEYLEYQQSIDRSQVPEFMASCDILIQPSEGENLGTSVAEALSCGLPVIVGSTNGTKDYISASSFVFEEYTPQSLKETMLIAIKSIEHDREKLCREARASAEKSFDLSKIVDSLEEILRQATQKIL
jgi:glycosyltransferase involved in cell wall biosynthesis